MSETFSNTDHAGQWATTQDDVEAPVFPVVLAHASPLHMAALPVVLGNATPMSIKGDVNESALPIATTSSSLPPPPLPPPSTPPPPIQPDLRTDPETGRQGKGAECTSPLSTGEEYDFGVDEEKLKEQPVFTVRIFVIGTLFTFVLSYVNQIGNYRSVNFSVDTTVAILLSWPLLSLLGRIPSWKFTVGSITLDTNPGVFNPREHMLLTCAMSDAAGTAYVANTLWFMENELNQNLGWMGDFLMIVLTKLIGYGLAAVFYRLLISSARMPWPNAIYQAELYRSLHEKDRGRFQVFMFFLMATFAYTWVPDFFWPGLSSIAVICWFSSSKVVGILGAGHDGFGIGSLNLNISDFTGYFSFMLYIPAWLGLNAVAGGILWSWVISPILYFTNYENAQNMPPMGFGLYLANGTEYPASDLFDKDGKWVQEVFDANGVPYLSGWFAFVYWFSFMALSGGITHTLCWHLDDCRAAFSQSGRSLLSKHAERMEKLFTPVPAVLGLVVTVVISVAFIITNSVYGIDMPWWSVVVSVLLASVFVLPIGAIQAVTGNQLGLNILAEMLGGLMLSHNPNGAILVKVTGYMGMSHALNLVQNMKMGQYLAVDYKAIVAFQLWGTIVTALADATAYRNVMDAGLTNGDNPNWNSSSSLKTYKTASYLWGGIGPWESFMGPDSHYTVLFWTGIGAGLVLPPMFYFLSKVPRLSFFKYVHIPMVSLMTGMPAINSWFTTALALVLTFQVALPRYAPKFYKNKMYVTVAGIVGGVGIASFAVAMMTGFGHFELSRPAWTNMDAGCSA